MGNIFEELMISIEKMHAKNEIIMRQVENLSSKQEETFLINQRIENDTKILKYILDNVENELHFVKNELNIVKNELQIVKKDVSKNYIILDYLDSAQNDSRENFEKIESVEDYLLNLKSSVGSITEKIHNLDANVVKTVDNLFKANWEFSNEILIPL